MDIYGEWLPTSGYKAANSPAFERYDQRFDSETSSGPFEIWLPIEPAR
jgi:AraC family transcriptional regulator